MENYITTFSGKRFDPIDPDPNPNLISIDDIAHALSLKCRFNGQCKDFYSVAQHSLLVASLLPPEQKLEGLMHDAAQAYISDITSPVKHRLSDYKDAHSRLWCVIAKRFGLSDPLHPYVQHANLVALATEKRHLIMGNDQWEMLEGIEPTDDPSCLDIFAWNQPYISESWFLLEFKKLTALRS